MDITHCPECTTAFKVSPEQLALASGWVRCGRCGAVFEAQRHLTPPSAEQATQATPSAMPAAVASEPAAASVGVTTPSAEPHATPWVARPEAAAPMAPQRVGAWIAGAGVLLLVLVWQLVLVQRHVLSAEEPALKPVLEVLCAPVGCAVSWPLEIDAVHIENTSFNENPAGGYTLQIRLRNTQSHPVATPHLELNLIDLQDQVVVRRVFSVQDMGLPASMAALRDARATVHFDLDAKVGEHVSGFRALIFYP